MADLQIDTPLGSILFNAYLDDIPISELSVDIASCKVVHAAPDLALPGAMSVAGSRAALLQCEIACAINSLVFECKWDDGGGLDWEPETGQYLAAQSWTNGEFLVMVGTEDDEGLKERASRGDDMPKAMARHLCDPSVVSYRPDGLAISLPPVPGGSRIGLHYVVAWNPAPEPVETSAWYAVDIPHAKIVSAAQGS
jgi:hypothetical protein